MKTILLTFTFITLFHCLHAQIHLKGTVIEMDGKPLPGANVYIKNSYDGATTDSCGVFLFNTSLKGKQILVASFIGFKNSETEVNLSKDTFFAPVQLNQTVNELRPVEIVAGAFEAGDAKRSVVLKLMDIATTPSAVGDVYGALTTFPGSQIVGDKGGLYVRGGEGYEAKTFFDGMQVMRPYFSSMPDMPERGRFSPNLFSGTLFTTGGYSAEYGQALSSALILNTTGLAEKTQSSVALLSVGANAMHTRRWDNASLAVTATYSNMSPYFHLFKQSIDWIKSPESYEMTALGRIKTGKYGLWKFFGSVNSNHSAIFYKPGSGDPSSIHLSNSDIYLNSVYTGKLSDKWNIKAGYAFTSDDMKIKLDTFSTSQPVWATHQRLTVTHEPTGKITLKFGEEIAFYSYTMNYKLLKNNNPEMTAGISISNPAVFAESEIRFSSRFALRAGLRTENVSLIHQWSIAPRVSLAYKTGENTQISAAYGLFSQRPEDNYLLFNKTLRSEQAAHYILNYQFEKEKRIFRMEVYRKNYTHLVKYTSENNPDPFAYNNNGYGYSEGIDLFWRDSRTIRNVDYWVSYSYLDTKRDYKNYSTSMMPAFVSPHTFSIVAKYLWMKTRTHWGINYTYASRKNWFSPGIPVSAKTIPYNDLSLNVLYLTSLAGNFTIIYLNVNNLPGFNNVFGYNYEQPSGGDGSYTLNPIKPASKRFLLLGVFVSFE